MYAEFGVRKQKLFTTKHQLLDFDLLAQKIAARVIHNRNLVVKDQVRRRHAKLTLILLLLNTLQSVIGRDATRALTWDTTIFKLTHCNVRLIFLWTGIWMHCNQNAVLAHSARIPKTVLCKCSNVLNSTTKNVCWVTCLSEIPLQVVPHYCSW